MSNRAVVPVGMIAKRFVEHGRIRFGMKNEKGQPVAIDHFRFTSHDEKVLVALADQYEGTVKPWSPKPGRQEFELISGATEIGVYLPPDPLGGTPVYEMWTAGGWQRRCDGLVCEMPNLTPDGGEVQAVPCICAAKGAMACKPITRLAVILPDIHFGGIWRMEAKGWNAAQELPAIVELVQKLQARGLTRATLALEKRQSVNSGQTRNYIVPVLRVPASVEQIAAGEMGIQGVKPVAAQGLETGMAGVDLPAELESGGSGDDDILDAEIIEGEEVTAQNATAGSIEDLVRKCSRLAIQLNLMQPDIAGFCFVVSSGKHEQVGSLTLEMLERMHAVFQRLVIGEIVYLGLDGRKAKVGKAK